MVIVHDPLFKTKISNIKQTNGFKMKVSTVDCANFDERTKKKKKYGN